MTRVDFTGTLAADGGSPIGAVAPTVGPAAGPTVGPTVGPAG